MVTTASEAGRLPAQPALGWGAGATPTNLAYVTATGAVTNSNGTGFTVPLADAVNRGLLASADFTKLGTFDLTGSAFGSILYYDGGLGKYVVLAPGTAGRVLQTNGAGAAPTWVAPGNAASGIQRTNKIIDVVQNGTAIEVWQNGVMIDSGSTAVVNDHCDSINAAITACAGTYTAGTGGKPGFGAGGLVRVGPGLWPVGSSGGMLSKWGVDLLFMQGGVDRNTTTFIADSSSMFGCCFTHGTGYVAGTPFLTIGTSAGGAGNRSTTNPHGIKVMNFASFADVDIVTFGIAIRDTSQVKIMYPVCVGHGHNASGVGSLAIDLQSTLAPDAGSIATEVIEPYFAWNDEHMKVGGTGSTDGRVVGGRWLQARTVGLDLGDPTGGGGWQVVGGGHWTTGNDAFHIDNASSPCIITGGHYFDTTGTGTGGDNYHIRTNSGGTGIWGNHFKCSTSGGPEAPILLTGNGRKASVGPNNFLFGAGTKAAVAVSAVGLSYALFGMNVDNDGAAYVSPVIVSGTSTVVTDDPTNKRWVTLNPENALS